MWGFSPVFLYSVICSFNVKQPYFICTFRLIPSNRDARNSISITETAELYRFIFKTCLLLKVYSRGFLFYSFYFLLYAHYQEHNKYKYSIHIFGGVWKVGTEPLWKTMRHYKFWIKRKRDKIKMWKLGAPGWLSH